MAEPRRIISAATRSLRRRLAPMGRLVAAVLVLSHLAAPLAATAHAHTHLHAHPHHHESHEHPPAGPAVADLSGPERGDCPVCHLIATSRPTLILNADATVASDPAASRAAVTSFERCPGGLAHTGSMPRAPPTA